MRLLLDMNLSPRLVDLFNDRGYDAIHWSEIGSRSADDSAIMKWARDQGYVVLTHDLDFGAILAASRAQEPSVLQVRTHDLSPDHIAPLLLSALERYHDHLTIGALVTLDENRGRVRILPISPRS